MKSKIKKKNAVVTISGHRQPGIPEPNIEVLPGHPVLVATVDGTTGWTNDIESIIHFVMFSISNMDSQQRKVICETYGIPQYGDPGSTNFSPCGPYVKEPFYN